MGQTVFKYLGKLKTGHYLITSKESKGWEGGKGRGNATKLYFQHSKYYYKTTTKSSCYLHLKDKAKSKAIGSYFKHQVTKKIIRY